MLKDKTVMDDEKDGLDALSKISGLKKERVQKIWDDVKDNQKVLEECERPHDFEQISEKFGSDYVCKKCGGKVRSIDAKWYKEGLKDSDSSQWIIRG